MASRVLNKDELCPSCRNKENLEVHCYRRLWDGDPFLAKKHLVVTRCPEYKKKPKEKKV